AGTRGVFDRRRIVVTETFQTPEKDAYFGDVVPAAGTAPTAKIGGMEILIECGLTFLGRPGMAKIRKSASWCSAQNTLETVDHSQIAIQPDSGIERMTRANQTAKEFDHSSVPIGDVGGQLLE